MYVLLYSNNGPLSSIHDRIRPWHCKTGLNGGMCSTASMTLNNYRFASFALIISGALGSPVKK
jgi:hypothetical protein